MINWNQTKIKLGRTNLDGARPKVITKCDKCGAEGIVAIRNKAEVIANHYQRPWLCRVCLANDPQKLENQRLASLKLWKDPEYKDKNLAAVRTDKNRERLREIRNSPEMVAKLNTPEIRKKASKKAKKQWKDPDFREKITASSRDMWKDEDLAKQMLGSRRTPQYLENQRIKALQRCSDPIWREEQRQRQIKIGQCAKYRENQRIKMEKVWADPEHREKMLKIFNTAEHRARAAESHANQPKVSSLQTILYSILDDLGVKYFREYPDKPSDPEVVVGPYNFDCVVPRENKPALLIECQGEYWHSSKAAIHNDKAKSSYIANNLADKYEVKYLWEHEFKCPDKIRESLKYWLGLGEAELVNFNFEDVAIKNCPPADYKLLLGKYHYLPNAGRGGIAYGAYLGDKLIGTCIFSPPIRQAVASSQGYKDEEVRELSRLCTHPNYKKKNFASWFVSRCVKKLDPKYKLVISYCDTTFNHDGAIYKACNFALDGTTNPDYWYVSPDGWVMHKKTLYAHASALGIKEADYALKMGYVKVWGSEKLRFIYKR